MKCSTLASRVWSQPWEDVVKLFRTPTQSDKRLDPEHRWPHSDKLQFHLIRVVMWGELDYTTKAKEGEEKCGPLPKRTARSKYMEVDFSQDKPALIGKEPKKPAAK